MSLIELELKFMDNISYVYNRDLKNGFIYETEADNLYECIIKTINFILEVYTLNDKFNIFTPSNININFFKFIKSVENWDSRGWLFIQNEPIKHYNLFQQYLKLSYNKQISCNKTSDSNFSYESCVPYEEWIDFIVEDIEITKKNTIKNIDDVKNIGVIKKDIKDKYYVDSKYSNSDYIYSDDDDSNYSDDSSSNCSNSDKKYYHNDDIKDEINKINNLKNINFDNFMKDFNILE